MKDLPALNTGRSDHGCAAYYTNTNQPVIFSLETLYSLSYLLWTKRCCWWQAGWLDTIQFWTHQKFFCPLLLESGHRQLRSLTKCTAWVVPLLTMLYSWQVFCVPLTELKCCSEWIEAYYNQEGMTITTTRDTGLITPSCSTMLILYKSIISKLNHHGTLLATWWRKDPRTPSWWWTLKTSLITAVLLLLLQVIFLYISSSFYIIVFQLTSPRLLFWLS